MTFINQQIKEGIKQGKKYFAWLIDPDKMSASEFERRLNTSINPHIDFIFLGGSLLVEDNISDYIQLLRKYSDKPIVLFPGGTNQIHKEADGLLLLSLISGRNPDFLIGRHVEVAAILKNSGLEILSTGYILVDSGVTTTASYISGTMPIPHHKNDIAASTAIAGELLGLNYIFLDAGSGAVMPVSSSMIKTVKHNINIPLIIGGGIKSTEQMKAAYDAGADIVVVGNVIEDNHELLSDFVNLKKAYSNQ